MLVAARKHFHTNEDLVADFDEQTGAIQIFGVRRVVAEVADPDKEISLEDARAINPDAGAGWRNPLRQAHRGAGPHLRADRQAGDSAKGARSRAREYLLRIFGPRGRTGHLRRQARGGPGPGGRPGQDRGAAAEERAVEARKLQRGRPHPLRHQERGEGRQERGRDRFARRAGAGDAPVRTGSSGNLRQHGGDQGLRAGSRRAHQDRGLQPRPRRG